MWLQKYNIVKWKFKYNKHLKNKKKANNCIYMLIITSKKPIKPIIIYQILN
jgi:hypothetical protein